MDIQSIQKAVNELENLRKTTAPSSRLAGDICPATLGEGYDLQNALSERLQNEKGPVCGHKIGCTTEVMQKFLNIEQPCAGRLYEKEIYSEAVELRLSDFTAVGVECEIAIRLGKDLTPGGQPFTQESVADAVDVAMAAAEIVDNRYADFHDFGIPSLVADDFFSAGAVLGPAVNLQGFDLSTAQGKVQIDGVEVGSGLGSFVMGHPLNALAWLANQKSERGEGLQAGDIIMTGSLVETQWIDKPCVVTCHVEPLGEVRMTFV